MNVFKTRITDIRVTGYDIKLEVTPGDDIHLVIQDVFGAHTDYIFIPAMALRAIAEGLMEIVNEREEGDND